MPDAADDLSRVADQLRLGLLRVDSTLTVIDGNRAAEALLGRPEGRLVGFSVMEAFVDHRVEETIARCLDGESGQMEIDAPDERRIIVRARRATAGGVLVTLEDVTDLRRLQRIRAEFIDNLAHELRTPLTTIRLLTERLLDELDERDERDGMGGPDVLTRLRERVATIDVETGHLVQMVQELLDLSRIEQATTRLDLEDVPIVPLLEASLHRMHPFADRQGVLLRAEEPGIDPRVAVRGDADRLGQVLVNLLHNALKFSPSGRAVTVRLASSDAAVVISIADEGPGISRADQARIFERFYKADRARPRTGGGTGLGLAIARHIVEAHGGRVWVESDEGSGAAFHVELPRAAPPG